MSMTCLGFSHTPDAQCMYPSMAVQAFGFDTAGGWVREWSARAAANRCACFSGIAMGRLLDATYFKPSRFTLSRPFNFWFLGLKFSDIFWDESCSAFFTHAVFINFPLCIGVLVI